MDRRKLLKPFQDLKNEIERLKKKEVVQDLVGKIQAERKTLEKKIEKTVAVEVKRAKKFLAEQQKELTKIQKKVETVMKKKSKKKTTKKKATTKKATTKKKASRA